MSRLMVLSMSGGLDSTTMCMRALKDGYTVLPITYTYGQKNLIEVQVQKDLIDEFKKIYGDKQLLNTINIDLTQSIGNVISTWQSNRDSGKLEAASEFGYYMPSRNLIFMSIAAVVGEIIAIDDDISHISLGLGIHKHSDVYARDYWDISFEFADRLQRLLDLNNVVTFEVYAPYADKYKKDIVVDSIILNVPYDRTWTCYNPKIEGSKYSPCKKCEACLEREGQAVGTKLEGIINNYEITLRDDTKGDKDE